MCGQVQAKYKCTQVIDTLVQFVNTKQEHGEPLVEYRKQFKQAKDNIKLTLGTKFLNEFTQHTDVYTETTDTVTKRRLEDSSWDCWTAFMLLKNSDRNEYGSLKNQLNSQYALDNYQ